MDDYDCIRPETMIDSATPVILTYNEEQNIGRTLEALRWAKRVVVLDSGSSDNTLEICSSFSNVDLHHRNFDNHTSQWNHAIELSSGSWVLSLDADYVISDELIREIQLLDPDTSVNAYFVNFRYCVWGRPLRTAIYPPRAVLFRRLQCRYVKDGHTQLLSIKGASAHLKGHINHDDRKPLSRWLNSQIRYASIEAEHLFSLPKEQLKLVDKLRLWILPAPFVMFFYCYFFKGLMLDGIPGLFYTLQRTFAELLLSLHLIELKYFTTQTK